MMHKTAGLTDEQAAKLVKEWARNRPHFEAVRDLMGHLINISILGQTHGHKVGLNYLDKHGRMNLDKAYEHAVAIHDATQGKSAKDRSEQVGDTVRKSMGRTPNGKPKAETPRESITKALAEVRGR
jgi:hypothetical protein